MNGSRFRRHTDLPVYQMGFELAREIFAVSRDFPREERYSLTDQIRRSSRSVCANVAEAWRRRRNEKAFMSKLTDAEGEAAETQVWLQFAVDCDYLSRKCAGQMYKQYDEILAQLVYLIHHAADWTIPTIR